MTRRNSRKNKFRSNPKRIFLLDSFGALLSAFFLFMIASRYEEQIGLHRSMAYTLSALACIYSIFSLSCFFSANSNWRSLLKTLIIANISHGLLMIWIMAYFYQNLTTIGIIYFLLELGVMISLILTELRIVIKPSKKSSI